MICQNCKIDIDGKFEFAIKSNNCPGCGKQIMPADQFSIYFSLTDLLSSICKENDVSKIVAVIMANFELKQTFSGVKDESTEAVGVAEEEDVEDDDPDAEAKKAQMEASKKILRKMREEALGDALEDRYGIGDGGVILGEDGAPNTFEMEHQQKRQDQRDTITSGLGGENSFRRV